MKQNGLKRLVENLAANSGSDYPMAFKLLGVIAYISEEGFDDLNSGDWISERTLARWLKIIKDSGLGKIVADARLRIELQEYMRNRFAGLPISHAKEEIVASVQQIIEEEKARSPEAISRQASAGVQGERSETSGREAQRSALDTCADGGSLEEATAPTKGVLDVWF